MKEIILYESEIIVEDGQGTETQDIAKSDPYLNLAKPVVSQTIPEMIGYIQKLNSPSGFVFGAIPRKTTAITHPDYPADPENPVEPASTDDLVITRKYVDTVTREAPVSTTNEVEQDIVAMFGNEFGKGSGSLGHGDKESPKVARYFTEYGEWLLTSKVNSDFISWLDTVCSNKGSCTIDTYNDMHKILGVIGELREALSKSTGKNGKPWILVTPRIAAFLSSTVGFVAHNNADMFTDGRITPNTKINPYIGSYGDIDVFTWLAAGGHPGDSSPTTETAGSIWMGYSGGPNISSVYYCPYRKYIVRGGSSAYTGQSTIFYKIRDAFVTNPSDTADHLGTDITIQEPVNNSKYIVKAEKPDMLTLVIKITPMYNVEILFIKNQIEITPIEHKIEINIPIKTLSVIL